MVARWLSREEAVTPLVDVNKLPRHVAIIMDGNGRWATGRAQPRLQGHQAGVTAVRETVRTCGELGVQALTLYAFSTENWRRPLPEVQGLMSLLQRFLRSEVAELHQNGVRLRFMGEREALPGAVRESLEEAIQVTADNTGLQLVLAINYSGRQEMARAVAQLLEDVRTHPLPPDVKLEDEIARRLYVPDLPDPDLLIRTGGEMRISNFMLWQVAYTELHVTPVFWPDFRREHLLEAFRVFAGRDRRFGGLNATAR